jgi:hypothetical protein
MKTITYLFFFTRSADQDQPDLFWAEVRKHIPQTLPKKFWLADDQHFDFDDPNWSRFIELWWRGYVWWASKKRPLVQGRLSLGNQHQHSGIMHSFDSSLVTDDQLSSVLIELSKVLRADYAHAHAVSMDGDVPGSEGELAGTVALGLLEALPGVPWAACYGKPYLDFEVDPILWTKNKRFFATL